MESDEIYRFVALRLPEETVPPAVRDPHIDAYGASASRSTLLADVTGKLLAGRIDEARLAARAAAEKSPANAWDAVTDTPIRELAYSLPTLARREDLNGAEKALLKALGTRDANRPEEALRLAEQRRAVADLMLCQALDSSLDYSLDAMAQIILCLETIERLTSGDAEVRSTWSVPLTRGEIILPITSIGAATGRAEAQRRLSSYLNSYRFNAPPLPISASTTLKPPETWIGDLILLRQKVRGYSIGEIAHIENVLEREHLERTFRTTRRTEQRALEEVETDNERSRDLQTTTRDEFREEIERAKAEELSLGANFDVQASYTGGAYSVAASVGGSASFRRSSEEREATASAHAREVIDRATQRIRERVRTERESISTYEQEDVSKHGIDNKEGTQHIVGVYRWLEKRLDLHLINYGRRVFYEFTVPEPATYWKRLVVARGSGAAGSPPPFPQLPPLGAGGSPSDLQPADFALRANDTPLAAPPRWADIVKLAAAWGVRLEDPPLPSRQTHLAFSVLGNEKGDAESEIHQFNNSDGSLAFYASPLEVGSVEKEKLSVPDGYIAASGSLSLRAPMYVRKSNNVYQFERGEVAVMLNGRYFSLPQGTPNATVTGNEWSLNSQLLLGDGLTGDVAVALKMNLNGAAGSIRLNCDRTEALESSWSRKMFALFGEVHEQRMQDYRDAQARAELESNRWAGSFPSATCRDIERRELKRGVLAQLTLNNLDQLGTAVLSDSLDASPGDPAVPFVSLDLLPDYARIVAFFERAFDWVNIAYLFAPYMYARRQEWAGLAVADDADAQFKEFLGAGAARVQVPVRRGHEKHAEYFFKGLGVHPFEKRIPWLGTMRSIAEDLAAEAREGFEVGIGSLAVTAGSREGVGTGTQFRDPEDLRREIRIDGKLYIIEEVESKTGIVLSRPYDGATATGVLYETGGVVVGPTIERSLPTTLVALAIPNLTMPSFPARYA